MILIFAIVLIPASVFSFSSHHSSLLKDGKPILRGGPELEDVSEIDQVTDKNQLQKRVESVDTNEPNELIWLLDLKHSLRRLVNQFGFEAAKPLLRRLVEDTEAARGVLLDIRVSRIGDSNIEFKYHDGAYYCDMPNYKLYGGGRRVIFAPATTTEKPRPLWISDLENEMQRLVREYGTERSLDDYLRPYIETLEEANNVKIRYLRRNIVIRYAERDESKGPFWL